jgi:hypothetical protein
MRTPGPASGTWDTHNSQVFALNLGAASFMPKPDALKGHGFRGAESRIPKNICRLQPAERVMPSPAEKSK